MLKKTNLIAAFVAVIAFAGHIMALDTDSVYSIHEVTVNAYRSPTELKRVPHNITVIDSRKIESLPSATLDNVLKNHENIDLVQYQGFSSAIGFRGFAPSGFGNPYTLILVNGIPAGSENISALDVENAAQVEVLKGPYSAFFGSNAMAGVVNITPVRSDGAMAGKLSLSGGSFRTYKINAVAGGAINSKFNFDVYLKNLAQLKDYKTGSANFLKLSDYEKQILDENSYGKTFGQSSYQVYNGGLRLGYNLNDKITIDLNQDIWHAGKIETNGNFWGTETAYQKEITKWSQSIVLDGRSGLHHYRVSPYFNTETVNFYNEVSDSNYLTSQYVFNTYGAVLQDAITIGSHRLIVGIDNHTKNYQSKQWNDRDLRGEPYQPDYSNISTGAYAQLNALLLNEKLNLALGGRIDYIIFRIFETDSLDSDKASENFLTFNPNAGLKYKVHKHVFLHASTGTAFVAPDAFKVAGEYRTMWGAYKGNKDLKPETSFSYDGGITYLNTSLGLRVDLTYFETHHKDMVVYDYPEAGITSFKNSKKAYMNGLETSFSFDFGAFSGYRYSLVVYTNYTHMLNTRVTIDSISSDMKYVRGSKGNFGVSLSLPGKISGSLNARYSGSRLEDNWLYAYDYDTWEKIPQVTKDGTPLRPGLINDDIIKFNDFVVFDLSVGYNIIKKIEMGLIVNNLLDENYAEKDGSHMPGRSITGRLSYIF